MKRYTFHVSLTVPGDVRRFHLQYAILAAMESLVGPMGPLSEQRLTSAQLAAVCKFVNVQLVSEIGKFDSKRAKT